MWPPPWGFLEEMACAAWMNKDGHALTSFRAGAAAGKEHWAESPFGHPVTWASPSPLWGPSLPICKMGVITTTSSLVVGHEDRMGSYP